MIRTLVGAGTSRARRRLAGAAVALLCVLTFLAAPAAAAEPILETFVYRTPSGWSVHVTIGGLATNENVTITLDELTLTTQLPDGNGSFEDTFGSLDRTVGNHTLGVHQGTTEILKTLSFAAVLPGPPTAVTAIAGNSSARISWKAPEPGSTPVVEYDVLGPGGTRCVWTSGPLSCTVSHLYNGAPATFTVVAITSDALGPASAPSAAVTPTFYPDVPIGAPFFADINWMAFEGITTGFGDGTFRPAGPVPRDAMAAFLYRVTGSPNGATPTCDAPPFPDVPKTAPFCGEIAWMATQGITTGYQDGGYHPTARVSRQAMSAFLYRFAGSPYGSKPTCGASPFADVPASSPFCPHIAWMQAEGISTGYAGNLYKPLDDIARQAMAAFLHRLAD